jgi:hypothetical protein
MHVLDYSILSDSLVIKKNISGSVTVTTTPPVVLDGEKPYVIAIGKTAVRDAIVHSNVRALLIEHKISVVI